MEKWPTMRDCKLIKMTRYSEELDVLSLGFEGFLKLGIIFLKLGIFSRGAEKFFHEAYNEIHNTAF